VTLKPAIGLLIAAGVCLTLAACGASSAERHAEQAKRANITITPILDGSERSLVRLEHDMSRDALALASRFDPAPHADTWGRPPGWTLIDLSKEPTLGWGKLNAADSAKVNALLPVEAADFAPAEPFILRATGPERERALLCMTQAVYYEAALGPLEGQQAVAQTVINRMRHPDFPKSVCGVVYEGSELPTGCQFSFTCDGSLTRAPMEPYWSRAKEVAEAALDGYVAAAIGPATHYHADYVFPAWGPQMVKITQLGAHIFYRFPGPAGDPRVLHGEYAGNELKVAMSTPATDAIALAQADLASGKYDALAKLLTAPVPPPASASTAAPADLAPTPARHDAAGVAVAILTPAAQPGEMVAGRRIPNREEIARVNAKLPPDEDDDAPIATARP
jgi:spore germination cell wall hydrolase CwlJ-like protein